jgi:hypothetical protein
MHECGATGGNFSRKLSFVSIIPRGSATVLRLPSARVPRSVRPRDQPTTSPSASTRAAVRGFDRGHALVLAQKLDARVAVK